MFPSSSDLPPIFTSLNLFEPPLSAYHLLDRKAKIQMGASQSVEVPPSEEEEDEEEEDAPDETRRLVGDDALLKKVLEQEPEMLPCHASASPLSPQLSSFGTPRLGPSIKVWDPYNVLAPPPSLPHFHRTFSSDSVDDDRTLTDLYLISNAECHMNLRPDLIAGRSPEAALTPNGKRQARALAVFLKSQGIRFSSVYTSPLDRARATALSVCQVSLLTFLASCIFPLLLGKFYTYLVIVYGQRNHWILWVWLVPGL